MKTFSHGSANHVVRSPATSATSATRNRTPLSWSSERVATTSSHNNATCVKPRWVTPAGAGSPVSHRGILDDFDHAVGAVIDADDRGFDDHGRRQELAHVARDRVALHAVGRREDGEPEHIAVPRDRGVDIGDVKRGVREPGDHENARSMPRTQPSLSLVFQPVNMPSLRGSHP